MRYDVMFTILIVWLVPTTVSDPVAAQDNGFAAAVHGAKRIRIEDTTGSNIEIREPSIDGPYLLGTSLHGIAPHRCFNLKDGEGTLTYYRNDQKNQKFKL